MKKKLLGCTILAGAALSTGGALAAEAPIWKLTGNANFQAYWFDQHNLWETTGGSIEGVLAFEPDDGVITGTPPAAEGTPIQTNDVYFGVDEAELQLDVSGTADNGLNYGFKIEINANTDDTKVADEARLQLSGGWGTLQLGDEDGAEDIMNYGGETLMGGTGGFDGDQDDYLLRIYAQITGAASINANLTSALGGTANYKMLVELPAGFVFGAPSYPTIAGDTSDQTKISYFSPRLSGFQVGASVTPTADFSPALRDFVDPSVPAPQKSDGDAFKVSRKFENHYSLGANYDSTFGDFRIRASAVYSGASANNASNCDTAGVKDLSGVEDSSNCVEDISAWSVGGIVGWGPVSLGANYTDNGDSGAPIGRLVSGTGAGGLDGQLYSTGWESHYWNVALGYEAGPLYFSLGYLETTFDWGAFGRGDINESCRWDYYGCDPESKYKHLSVTADYTVAAGLGLYAEVNFITDDNNIDNIDPDPPATPVGLQSLDTTSVVLGANVSF